MTALNVLDKKGKIKKVAHSRSRGNDRDVHALGGHFKGIIIGFTLRKEISIQMR
jgi:hypothetical protein